MQSLLMEKRVMMKKKKGSCLRRCFSHGILDKVYDTVMKTKGLNMIVRNLTPINISGYMA